MSNGRCVVCLFLYCRHVVSDPPSRSHPWELDWCSHEGFSLTRVHRNVVPERNDSSEWRQCAGREKVSGKVTATTNAASTTTEADSRHCFMSCRCSTREACRERVSATTGRMRRTPTFLQTMFCIVSKTVLPGTAVSIFPGGAFTTTTCRRSQRLVSGLVSSASETQARDTPHQANLLETSKSLFRELL